MFPISESQVCISTPLGAGRPQPLSFISMVKVLALESNCCVITTRGLIIHRGVLTHRNRMHTNPFLHLAAYVSPCFSHEFVFLSLSVTPDASCFFPCISPSSHLLLSFSRRLSTLMELVSTEDKTIKTKFI